jgi:hypothetical protein
MHLRQKTADSNIYYVPYVAEATASPSDWAMARLQIRISSSGATPISLTIVPDYVGQIAINDTSNTAWIALGTASAYDWALITLTTYAPS